MNKKSIYGRVGFWIVAILLGVLIFAGDGEEDTSRGSESESVETVAEKEEETAKEEETEAKESEETKESTKLEGEELRESQKKLMFEGFNQVVESSEGFIIDIDFDGNAENRYKVIVSDIWYLLAQHEKERIVMEIDELVTVNAWNSDFEERGTTLKITIYDEYGEKVATKSVFSGKYDIKK